MSKENDALRRFVAWYGTPAYISVLSRLQDSGIIGRARAAGLDPRQAVALHVYTTERPDGSALFRTINAAIRHQDALALVKLMPAIQVMTGALLRLPPFAGVVYRRTDLPRELEERLVTPDIIGKPFMDRGFFSASTRPSTSPGRWSIILYGKTGRDIGSVAPVPTDREILFLPSTPFTIRNIGQTRDHRMLLMLEEE